MGKGEGKVCPVTSHEGPEGESCYSYTVCLTTALDGGGWSMPCPARFHPGKEIWYSLYRTLGGVTGPVWIGAENLVQIL